MWEPAASVSSRVARGRSVAALQGCWARDLMDFHGNSASVAGSELCSDPQCGRALSGQPSWGRWLASVEHGAAGGRRPRRAKGSAQEGLVPGLETGGFPGLCGETAAPRGSTALPCPGRWPSETCRTARCVAFSHRVCGHPSPQAQGTWACVFITWPRASWKPPVPRLQAGPSPRPRSVSVVSVLGLV